MVARSQKLRKNGDLSNGVGCGFYCFIFSLWHDKPHRIHGAGIYANIWGILMGSMLPYIAYMDPMGDKP